MNPGERLEAVSPVSVAPAAPSSDPFHQAPLVQIRTWQALSKTVWPSVRFLFETEVHVYSFAVAANVLISFFPFLVVLLMICRYALHWQGAVNVILQSVHYYFPEKFGLDFRAALLTASAQRRFSWLSVLLILFTSNGIFEPLEVALNRIWRVKANRPFVYNQAVSLGLIFACGILLLGSISLTAVNFEWLKSTFGASRLAPILQLIVFEAIALPMTTLMIFLIYWKLPNAKIPVRRIAYASLFVGILLEILKYLNILTWPWLREKLTSEVPPFVQSISILLWSFAAAMIILAGAEWSARVTVQKLEDESLKPTPFEAPASDQLKQHGVPE